MKHVGIATTLWFGAVMGICGCAGTWDETSNDIGTAPSPIISLNSLDPRAIEATPAYSGGLTPSMLSAGPLAVSSFGSAVMAAIQDSGESGALSRHLLSYTVSCALAPSQSLSVTWSDSQGSHTETYTGLF